MRPRVTVVAGGKAERDKKQERGQSTGQVWRSGNVHSRMQDGVFQGSRRGSRALMHRGAKCTRLEANSVSELSELPNVGAGKGTQGHLVQILHCADEQPKKAR